MRTWTGYCSIKHVAQQGVTGVAISADVARDIVVLKLPIQECRGVARQVSRSRKLCSVSTIPWMDCLKFLASHLVDSWIHSPFPHSSIPAFPDWHSSPPWIHALEGRPVGRPVAQRVPLRAVIPDIAWRSVSQCPSSLIKLIKRYCTLYDFKMH